MSEKSEPKLEDLYKNTLCYTYEVTMVVQVLAPDRAIADTKLDQEGGYVSKRSVVFKEATLLYDGSPVISDSDEDKA